MITREGHHRSGKIVGVDSSYFSVMNLAVQQGSKFNHKHFATSGQVAIIGQGVKSRFFTTEDPIGRGIKVGSIWVTVVGVLEDRQVPTETSDRRSPS